MKVLIFLILFSCSLIAKQSLKIPIFINGDTCNKSCILFVDSNNDNIFDVIIFDNCNNKLDVYSIIIKSLYDLNDNNTALLKNGSFQNRNFVILIYDPNSFRYTHKLYYDIQLSKAILEDYTDNSSETASYEEADNYFYTQQMGSTLLITKKADINVQSVFLCSLDGRVIANLQNLEGWSQFSFDMSLELSGMYLLRFIARDKALTKRIVYLR